MKVFTARFLHLTFALFGGLLFNGVVAHAASVAVTAGQPVTLTATADGTAPFSYQWYKNGIVLSGAADSTYTISNFQAGDAGTYSALISNSAGSDTTDEAVLTLSIPDVAPVFTTQPTSQVIATGNAVTFTAAASGTPAPTFQWKKDGATISGATAASYTIANTTTASAGTYTVVASNAAGTITSNGAILSINTPPSFTTQPASQSVTAGGSVTFTAAASGTPTPTFQWKKGGVTIPGATNASLTLWSVAMGDAGSYTVVATNSVNAVTSNAAILSVNAATVAPTITSQPIAQTVTVGGSATFTVSASGTPAPTFQWRKNGANITGAIAASYTIANVTLANTASYTVVVTNSAGSVTSTGASLTVYSSPTFTIQPGSQNATVGGSVTFIASASGNPAPTFQWKKGGSVIAGATSGSYTISNVVTGSAGSYTVVATNLAGTVTSSTATLTVDAAPTAPVITTQPATQTVIAGDAVTLVAAASGTPAPTFQWKKDGLAIPGATSAFYSIPAAAATDEASYTVVASNSMGVATSNKATLSVISAPKKLIVTLTIQ